MRKGQTSEDTAVDPRDVFGPRWKPGPGYTLHFAVMEDAANILRCFPPASAAFAETLTWVLGRCWSTPTFGFEEICEVMGLNVEATRARMLALSRGPRETRAKQSHRTVMPVRIFPGRNRSRRRAA